MPLLNIGSYVSVRDAENVRKILQDDENKIKYKNDYGESLLHILISSFRYNDPKKVGKAEDTLQVLFEYNIDPTIRTIDKSHMTAKEFAQHLSKPQELIDTLEAYEVRWRAKHTSATQQPTSDLRKRHRTQSSSSGTSSAPSSASTGITMQLHQ